MVQLFGNGETVLLGILCSNSRIFCLAGTITLDAQGDPSAVFVFEFIGAFS
jgi:hypothetical protein